MKNIFYFICCFAWLLGAVGGTAYCFYFHEPVMAVCVLALAAMSFPFVKDCFKHLKDGE